MKKIMFDNKFGLTDAVLQGRKTMTRRLCKEFRTGRIIYSDEVESVSVYSDENLVEFVMKDGSIKVSVPPYKPGEIVAVAQAYKSIHEEMMSGDYGDSKYDAFRCAVVAGTKGWTNKMFVRANLMPHQIRITDIKAERLQDISEEDCLKEGLIKKPHPFVREAGWVYCMPIDSMDYSYPTQCFADLIDAVSGKGTWERDPYNFACSFELLK